MGKMKILSFKKIEGKMVIRNLLFMFVDVGCNWKRSVKYVKVKHKVTSKNTTLKKFKKIKREK